MAIPGSNRSSSPPSPSHNAMTPLSERPHLSDEEDVKKTDDDSGGSTEQEDDDEEEEDEEVSWPELPPPGCLDPLELPKPLLMGTCTLENRMLVPLLVSFAFDPPSAFPRFDTTSTEHSLTLSNSRSSPRHGMIPRSRARFVSYSPRRERLWRASWPCGYNELLKYCCKLFSGVTECW